MELKDSELVEADEEIASQVVACDKALNFSDEDMTSLNVDGSGISLGHAVGCTGVRILTTLLREMDRREARYGVETMCIGGGQGLAAVFERVVSKISSRRSWRVFSATISARMTTMPASTLARPPPV